MRREGLKPLSHEGIYKYLLRDKASGASLHIHLRHKLRNYRRRGSPKERRGRIPNQCMIDTKPQVVEERTRFGDYKMDTDTQIEKVREKLNNRPRKHLGWRTPNEVISGQAAIVALPS